MNLRKLKIQFFRKPLIISLLIALFIAGIVKAVPPVSPYRPGETLDPSCFPGDPNCTVSPPLPTYISTTTIVELNNNLLSFNTGTVSILGNLGIGTTTPVGIFHITNGAVNALVVDNNGNVGIGTTSPLDKLEVAGNIRISFNGQLNFSDGNPIITSIFDDFILVANSDDIGTGIFHFYTSGNKEAMTILDENVGIGSTTPSYKLTVAGDFFVSATSTLGSLTSTPVIFGGYVMSDVIPYSDLTYNLGSPSFRWANLYVGTTTISNSLNLSYLTPGSVLFLGPSGQISQNNQKLFWDNTNFRLGIGTNTPQGIFHVATGTVNALVVDNSGNVGIGTTVPAYTLDINTTKDWGGVRIIGTQNVQLVFESPTGFTPQYTFVQGSITRFTNFVSSDGSYWAIGRFDDNGNYLDAPLTILRNTGNVGIGTTAPAELLDVNGVSRFLGVVKISSVLQGDSGANFDLNLRPGSSLGNIIFKSNADAELARITNNGNVGIGTTTPAYKLSVQGSIQQTNALSCALSSDANGQIICTVSSLKYKENIQDLTFDSERFLSLQPKSFEFKKDLPFYLPGKQVGFISEEVQNVFPDLVRYKDGEPEGVKYENLPIYLFAIIKDFFNKMKNGLITFKDIVVDKLSANYIIVKELGAEKVVSKELCSSTGKCVQVTDELINKLIELSGSNSGLSSPSNGGNNNPGTIENNNQQNSNNEVNNQNQENQTSNNSNQTSNENQTNSGSGETTSNNQTPSDQSNSSNP